MLVVFDVDGTLALSTRIDAEAYARAFEDAFGMPLPSTRWSDYAAPTDQGIAEESCDRLGLDRARIPDFKDRFTKRLRSVVSQSSS